MKDYYKLCESGVYNIPNVLDYSAMMQYIENLPLSDAPEAFGLHENANIILAKSETTSLLKSALSLQKKAISNRGKSWTNELINIIDDIKQRIPLPFDMDYTYRIFPMVYEESMNTVLIQELLRFNHLLKTVIGQIDDLVKGIKGTILMTPELEPITSIIFQSESIIFSILVESFRVLVLYFLIL